MIAGLGGFREASPGTAAGWSGRMVAVDHTLFAGSRGDLTMPLILRWRGAATVPVDGAVIRPDRLGGRAPSWPARPSPSATVGGPGDLFVLAGDGGDGT